MSNFWSFWIISLTVLTLVGTIWLLFANRKSSYRSSQNGLNQAGEPPTTGHSHDGIEEYDNPLPAWWLNLFLGTILFSVIYLILFPGLGSFPGLLEWTQEKSWQSAVDTAERQFQQQFKALSQTSIAELAQNKEAMRMGQRLFANNCAACHGSNARGAVGFPNLTDDAWLWGGSAEAIKTSIADGRTGSMPAWGSILNDEQITQVTDYVVSLSSTENTSESTEGKTVFQTYCAACHGAEGQGMTALGAPDLTDTVWLYGGNPEAVRASIEFGRSGKMPAHKPLISAEKIHILSAYVYSLSN